MNYELKIERVLGKRIKRLIRKNEVHIKYKQYEQLEDGCTLAGIIYSYIINGKQVIIGKPTITINKKFKRNPYVLAHEYGHYISIKTQQNNTEHTANEIAWNTINKLTRNSKVRGIIKERFESFMKRQVFE